MAVSILAAGDWLQRAEELRSEGWLLVDLCGVDALGLTRNLAGAELMHPGDSPDPSTESSGPQQGSEQGSGDGAVAAPDSGAQDSGLHPSTAMEMPYGASVRFQVAVQLLHPDSGERRSLRVFAEGEPPTIPSVTKVWPTSNFMEREAFDLFGIHFDGHPDLKRILMPEEWEGYPLRKDYGVGKVPVEFVPQPFLQIETPGQGTDAEESRVEVDALGQVTGVKSRRWGQR